MVVNVTFEFKSLFSTQKLLLIRLKIDENLKVNGSSPPPLPRVLLATKFRKVTLFLKERVILHEK